MAKVKTKVTIKYENTGVKPFGCGASAYLDGKHVAYATAETWELVRERVLGYVKDVLTENDAPPPEEVEI